jgi:hypothetical protein
MADHRLDGPERDALSVRTRLGEHVGERLHLRPVAGDGARSVRLDEPDRRRRDAGVGVRPPERAHLSFGARRGQAAISAVAGRADAFDDGVDPVAVALRVGEPLEHDRGEALADGDAVGLGVEGPAPAVRRERLRLAEAEVAEGVLDRVDPPGEDHVARAVLELAHREADGGERRRAGGIDRVVRAAEVEPVRDAPRGDVHEDPRERVLGPLRQRVAEALRQLPAVAAEQPRERRAHRVADRKIGAAAARAEDDGRALARERPVGIARVVERGPRDEQAEQLERLDRAQRVRGHPEGDRVERDGIDEPAPLRVDLVARGAVGVVVLPPVPARRGDLGDGVDLVDDVRPEAAHVRRAGEDRAEADDGDVRGGRCRLPDGEALGGPQAGEDLVAPVRERAVQVADRRHLVAERRDLADHEHAARPLLLVVERDELGRGGVVREARVPVDALRGDAEPAEVHELQPVAQLAVRCLLAAQPALLLAELVDERRGEAPGRMARARLEQRGLGAGDGRLLESRRDRTRADGLLGEEVRRPHENADSDPTRRERGGERGDHGGRPAVVDPAGEQHVVVRRVAPGGEPVDEGAHHRVPEHEARARADVASALATLEHEPPRAVLEVQPEQAGRRHVQVRPDPGLLEHGGLIRAATRDQRERRRMGADRLELLLTQLGRHEAEDPRAPRPVPEEPLGLLEQPRRVRPAHERQCEERQRAAFGDRRRELGSIADAGHRPLRDRIASAVRLRERPSLRERIVVRRDLDLLRDRGVEAGDDSADRGEAPREIRGERGVLPDGEERGAGVVPADARTELGPPRAPQLRDVPVGELDLALELPERRDGCQRRSGVDPDRRVELEAVTGRLAAVHRAELRLNGLRQRRLAGEQELAVEDGARRARDGTGGGGVEADSAMGPDRRPQTGGALLQQDERALGPDEASGLVALGNHGVEPRGLPCLRLGEARCDEEGAGARPVDRGEKPGEQLLLGAGDEDDVEVDPRAEDRVQMGRRRVHEHAAATAAQRDERPERRKGGVPVRHELEVQDADRTGTASGDREARIRRTGGGEDDPVEARLSTHRGPLDGPRAMRTRCAGSARRESRWAVSGCRAAPRSPSLGSESARFAREPDCVCCSSGAPSLSQT